MAYNNIFTIDYIGLNESLQIGDTIYYAKNTTSTALYNSILTNPNQLSVVQFSGYETGSGVTSDYPFSASNIGSSYGSYDYYQQGLIDATNDNDIVKIGQLHSFKQSEAAIQSSIPKISLHIVSQDYLDPVPDGVYLFFSKDNRANLASLTGYYGLVRLKNNSRNKAELYAASSEAVQSSK